MVNAPGRRLAQSNRHIERTYFQITFYPIADRTANHPA